MLTPTSQWRVCRLELKTCQVWSSLMGPAAPPPAVCSLDSEIFPPTLQLHTDPSASQLHRTACHWTPSAKEQLSSSNVVSFLKLILLPEFLRSVTPFKPLKLATCPLELFPLWILHPLEAVKTETLWNNIEFIMSVQPVALNSNNVVLWESLREGWECYFPPFLLNSVTPSNHQIVLVRLAGITRLAEQGAWLSTSFQRFLHVGIKKILKSREKTVTDSLFQENL